MALNDKQRLFAQEYIVDFNATAAAKRAGYSEKTAGQIGHENLKKPEIQQAIREAVDARDKRLQISQDRVVEELAAIAFARGTDYMQIGDDGGVTVTPTCDLTEDQRKAVACIKKGRFGAEVQTFDKIRALEMLGKHLGMFDKPEKENDGPPAVVVTIQGGDPSWGK